ncbi:ubiquitin carboxyl-terminal hydrolase 8 [Anabrus simplex]|uniref:ubiquitin carboxyl-terminal hydrolase 8 n=1 Tax=Anabrus simplex TaxID=316456 RepID=UPI0035A38686
MQEGKLKPLYKGKCMEDLRKEFDTSFEGKSNKLLCKSLPKLLQTADSIRLAGDEEYSYVLYMKYLSLVQYIKANAKDEYCTKVLKNFNYKDVTHALDCAESLSKSLVKRYEQKKSEEEERKRKESEIALREVEIEVKDKPKLTQPVTNGLPESSEVSVTCTELFTLLKSEKMKILIMDARPASSFKESQLKFPGRVISIPEEIVKKGASAAALQRTLPEESKPQWKARGTMDLVVLLDWNTSTSTFTPDSTLYVLRDILTKWDLQVKYKKNPVILDGGYEEWLLRYPAYTTNSKVKPPGEERDSITDLLDDIQYPTLIEQAPKPATVTPAVDRKAKPIMEPSSSSLPTVRLSSKSSSSETSSTSVTVGNRSKTPSSDSTSTSIPSVDRAAKKAAIQTYEERAQYMRKLLSIADSSLELEEKRLKAEEEWESLRVRREREAEEEMRFELQEREAQLLDSIQRLEKLQLEKEQENTSLRLLLDEYKRKEEERNKADSGQMKQEEEITAIIRSKEEEKLKISTKREEKFKERERRVAEERKNKPLNFPQLEKEQKEREMKLQEYQEQEKLARDKLEEDKKRAALRAAQEAKDERRDKGAYITQLKDGPSNSMRRSHSFPNIAQLDGDDDIADVHHKVPSFDRSIKPLEKPQPSEVRAARQRNFNPVYGSLGRGLTGLKNLGNTCYMNSIIQCLNNTTPLAKYFICRDYLKDINHNNNKTHGEVAEEVAAVVQALWSGQYRSIAIRDLRNVVGLHRNQFQTTQQQDSSEFLTILMDWLHEDLKQENNMPKREVIHDQSEWERQWQKFYQDNTSVVVALFYGQQKSTVCCLKCHEESVTFETFSNLTLPLPSDANRCSLEDCVQLYLQGERISGWKCPSCKEPRDAVKKFDIIKLPPILVVHLKRFCVEGWCRKRQTFVDFPLDDFEMKKYVVNRDQKYTNFNLYGVSNHYGTMEGGHYTAYCKSSFYHKWYKFDDHEVSELSPSDVRSGAAYILFYSSVNSKIPIFS